MMAYFYSNSSLTTQLIVPVEFVQNFDGSTGDVIATIYLGDPDNTKSIYAASNPGVDNIVVSISDTTPASGPAATDVKLATSLNGLNTAIAGASLTIGTSVVGGVGGAVPIYIKMKTPTVDAAGTFNQLSISTNPCVKY